MSFSDPQGPRAYRLLALLPAVLLLALAFSELFESGTSVAMGLAGLLSLNFVGILPPRQTRKKPTELETGPGWIRIKGAGLRSQRIHAKSLRGATTARTATGILFTLAHADRDQPITLEVESDADAERVRQALGIGHGGFGEVAWRTTAGGNARSALVGRLLSLGFGSLLALVAASAGAGAAIALGIVLFPVLLPGLILSITGALSKTSDASVVMSAEGIRLQTPRGWFQLPYNAVLGIEERRSAVVFQVPPPFHEVGVEISSVMSGGASAEDRAHMQRQIMSASDRARGFGPQKEEVAGRVEVLRRKGESPRDWLMRLDMAGQMLGAGPGYRGHAFDAQDLWTILEDPDADAELRAAAARVLRHAPEPQTRVRIDAAVAAVRDPGTARRLRIAVEDDLEEASQELAVLDANLPPQYARGVRM